jgi:hypothetical protein
VLSPELVKLTLPDTEHAPPGALSRKVDGVAAYC